MNAHFCVYPNPPKYPERVVLLLPAFYKMRHRSNFVNGNHRMGQSWDLNPVSLILNQGNREWL